MSRDIETLRRRLEEHRDALRRLEADAPADALADQYAQLADWIERRLASLAIDPPDPALPPLPVDAATTRQERADRSGSEPEYSPPTPYLYEPEPKREGVRTAAVLLIGLAAAALLAFLFFRFFAEDRTTALETAATEQSTIQEAPAPTADEPRIVEEDQEHDAPEAAPSSDQSFAPPAYASVLVEPARANVSGFAAGRAIQQFRIENRGPDAVRIAMERSRCRCLWYDYQPVIPAGGGVVLEVTVDGARLEGDRLDERVGVLEAGTRRRLAELEISGYR